MVTTNLLHNDNWRLFLMQQETECCSWNDGYLII